MDKTKRVESVISMGIEPKYAHSFANLPDGIREDVSDGHMVGTYNNRKVFREILGIASMITDDITSHQAVTLMSLSYEENVADLESKVKAIIEAQEPVGYIDEKPIFDIESYTVEKTEFKTVEEFVKHTAESWAEDSEYRSFQSDEDAETQLAFSVLSYVNYFENEIEEMGMTKVFEEWQRIAYDMWNNHGTKAQQNNKDLALQFEKKMNEILTKL